MINLKELLSTKENKNLEVLKLNHEVMNVGEMRDSFSTIFGGVCGADNGILYEESLEDLFRFSNIEMIFKNTGFANLIQNNNEYRVQVVVMDEGSSTPSDHFDFNTLEAVS